MALLEHLNAMMFEGFQGVSPIGTHDAERCPSLWQIVVVFLVGTYLIPGCNLFHRVSSFGTAHKIQFMNFWIHSSIKGCLNYGNFRCPYNIFP